MKLAIIGATGYVGTSILSEALSRGHTVTAIVQNPDKLPNDAKLTPVKADVGDTEALKSLIAGHDAIISAFNPGKDESGVGRRSIVEATKATHGGRLVAVGGAGTLEIAPGKRLIDQPDFPAEWKDGALKTADFLGELRGEKELNWTFVCPAAMLAPGERTGKYRVGGDQLMTDAEGQSRISLSDFAVAMLDEVEKPKHPRQRFCVAY